MQSRVKVRSAAPDDESFLRGLFARTRPVPMNGPGFRALAEMQYDARGMSYAAQSAEAPAIIELDGIAVGSVWVWRSADEIRVADIAVEPEFQGCGIGRHVLASLIAESCRLKRPLRLRVDVRNEGAIHFYSSLGFASQASTATDVEMEYQARSNVIV